MKPIAYIFSVFLVLTLIPGLSQKLFSQTTGVENKKETKDSIIATTGKDPGYVKGITAGRAVALAEGVLGLMSLIIGWRAKARYIKPMAKLALALGTIAIILSVIHLATAAGAVFGSGSGKAGSIVALVLAVTGSILGRATLNSRKNN